MSTKRTASSLRAVQAADDLSALAPFLGCPTCKLPFWTHPLVFGCGHSVCSECADAMRACVPALCLLCQLPIVSCLENRGLGEFIQEALRGCASACPPPGSPRSAKKPKVSQAESDAGTGLLPLLDRFAAASATLYGAAQAAAEAKVGVLSNALLCVDVFNHAVDGSLVGQELHSGQPRSPVLLNSHQQTVHCMVKHVHTEEGVGQNAVLGFSSCLRSPVQRRRGSRKPIRQRQQVGRRVVLRLGYLGLLGASRDNQGREPVPSGRLPLALHAGRTQFVWCSLSGGCVVQGRGVIC